MAIRLTKYPSGLEIDHGQALKLQASEPSGVLFSDGVAYANRIKAGGTYGMLWLEADGIHYNTNGTERIVPLTSTSGNNSLDIAYDVGSSITVDGGAVTLTDPTTGSTNTLAISKSSTNTGNAIDIDMNASVGGRALQVDAGGGARTQELMYIKLDGTFDSAAGGTVLDLDVTQTGAAASDLFDIDVSSIYTGDIFNVVLSAASTGSVIDVDMDAAVGAKCINIDAGAGTRTVDLMNIKFDGDGDVSAIDIAATNTGSGNLIDVTVDAIHTGNALSVVYGTSAATGDAVSIDMGTNIAGGALVIAAAGVRTDSLIDIADASTGSVAVVKVATSAVYTGNVVELSASAAATGNMIDIDMNANLAGNAIYIDNGAGARTGNMIEALLDGAGNVSLLTGTVTSTGSGAVIDLNVDSVHTGNGLDITYGNSAATGNAIDLNMGTNVAGMALSIDSASTGTAVEGAAIDVNHTGALIANADLMRLVSSGSHNAASNLLYIEGSGASAAGTYAVNINASGTNIEALKVDAGGVVFDETLAVAGATTMTGTLTVGVDGTGLDVKFFGATSGAYMLWDESADDLILAGAAGLSVAAATTLTGLATLTAGIDAAVIFAGIETIAAGGTSTALSLVKTVHDIDADAGGDIFTLANGTAGQLCTCVMKSATGTATITPATFLGGTSVTFDAAGDSVTLQYTTNGWFVVGGNSYTVI